MKFIALKTCDGGVKGRISFCCKVLKVTRQGFHDYLKNRNKPWKHEELAAKMMEILSEDECNDTYGRERMHKALLLKYPDSKIPSETTVYRVMTAIGITHRPNRKPNGITNADREARKSDDLLKCKKSIISNIYIAIEKALPIELKGNAFFMPCLTC